jgi:hypothetical protein
MVNRRRRDEIWICTATAAAAGDARSCGLPVLGDEFGGPVSIGQNGKDGIEAAVSDMNAAIQNFQKGGNGTQSLRLCLASQSELAAI